MGKKRKTVDPNSMYHDQKAIREAQKNSDMIKVFLNKHQADLVSHGVDIKSKDFNSDLARKALVMVITEQNPKAKSLKKAKRPEYDITRAPSYLRKSDLKNTTNKDWGKATFLNWVVLYLSCVQDNADSRGMNEFLRQYFAMV